MQVQRLWPEKNFKRKNKSTAYKSKPPLCPNIRPLRKHACKCTHAPGTPDMTSCKVCSLMRVNLKIYSQLRKLLYYNAGEVRALKPPKGTTGWCSPKPTSPCTACNGLCHPGKPYRTFSRSPDEALATLLCDKVRRPYLEMDALNAGDIPDATLPRKEFAHSPLRCHEGTCSDCGLLHKFEGINGGVITTVDGVQCRFCPIEYCDSTLTWYQWSSIDCGISDATGKVIKRVEFMPRVGTWKVFLRTLRSIFVDYCSHRLHMLTFNQSWRLMERELMHHPALRRAGYHDRYPVHQKGVAAVCVSDFSTSLDHVRLMTATCQYPERTHLCVVVICHSPYMMRVVDLPPGRHRENMLRKGHTTKLMYVTAVFYGYAKLRSCAMFQMNVMVDAMSILNLGKVGNDSLCEAFEGRTRLPGGRADMLRLPLKHGLVDRVVATPCAKEPIAHVVRRRDNCGDQYNGAPAFKGVEQFRERTGVDMTDEGSVPGEGKHVCDGYGSGPQNELRKHAVAQDSFSGETYADGTRNMVMFVASKLHTGAKAGKFTRGRWSVDHYYHLYYNEVDGFDRTLCPAAHTWKGSDSHNVFFTTPNRGLGRRYMLCWCARCSLAKYSECLSCSREAGMAKWYGGVGADAYTYIRAKTALPPRENLRSQVDPILTVKNLRAMKDINANHGPATDLKRVCAIRVEAGSFNPQKEEYFLVRPTKKPWKTRARCHAAGAAIEKGALMFEGNYFVFGRSERGTSNRVYTLMEGPGAVATLPLSTVVHDVGDLCFESTRRTENGQPEWILHEATHDRLLTVGSLTATD